MCYRVSGMSLEFLLVNTSAGKWTFPKGRISPSLSASQSAEREAMEEAGAHGQIEESHFGWYVDTKRALGHEGRVREILVAAYLLEVHGTVSPEERGRNPTWFTPQEAKRKLGERRDSKYSSQMATLVDVAVKRVASPEPRFQSRDGAASRRSLARQ